MNQGQIGPSPSVSGTVVPERLSWADALPLALLRFDRSGRVGLRNTEAHALLEALGLPLDSGWDVLQALDPALADALRAQVDTPGLLAHQRPLARTDGDGHVRHLQLTLAVPVGGWVQLALEDVSAAHDAFAAQHSSEHRYRALLEHIPAGVVVHGASSAIEMANAEASRLLGLSPDQLMGRVAVDPRWQFQHEDGRPFALSEFPVNRVLSSGESLKHLVIGLYRPDLHGLVWVICNAFPVHDDAGDLRQVVVSFVEVTQLQQAQQALQQSEERLRLVLRGSNDAPWDWDLLTNRMHYAPRWWTMLGLPPDEDNTDATLWTSRTHPDDLNRVLTTFETFKRDGTESFEEEFRLRHANGHYVPVLCRGFILRNAQGEPIRVSGTNADLTERKRAEAHIHHLAYFDALTDLPNRRNLLEQLRRALTACSRGGEHGALLFIDLDHFKELNDTRGHDMGDALLQQVAKRLRLQIREADLVARLGGDEFVVMLEHLDADPALAALEAERVGLKLLDSLTRGYRIGGQPYRGTPSIGMTLFSADSEGVDALLKQADLAMYQAKAAGRNTLRFFDERMQADRAQRVSREAELRRALKRGELRLAFQAQVHHTQGLQGAEVLVRWQHPQQGLLLPGDFIPVAEATGQILALGQWVLREACCQLARWAVEPALAGLSLSVNVSVHQFRDVNFVDQVHAVLRDTGAPPQRLKLELTESALAEHIEELIAKMQQLRALGVGFSLDDFGTGYSSLSYLKRLPLDQLKIDRAFVRDVLTDPSDATLSRIIISLAKEFGLAVVAEGVETEAQREFLQDLGCQDFQGYLFGRPEPVTAFEARALESWHERKRKVRAR